MKIIKKALFVGAVLGVSFLAMPIANASNATLLTTYTCNDGDSLNGDTCTTPIVNHPAVSQVSYSATSGVVITCPANGSVGWVTNNRWVPYACSPRDNMTLNYYWNPLSVSNGLTCPDGGTLTGEICITTEGQAAYTTGGSTYAATATQSYTCPQGYTQVGNTCTSPQDGVNNLVLSPFDVVIGFIKTYLLPAIIGLVLLGIAVRVGINAVRKYSSKAK